METQILNKPIIRRALYLPLPIYQYNNEIYKEKFHRLIGNYKTISIGVVYLKDSNGIENTPGVKVNYA